MKQTNDLLRVLRSTNKAVERCEKLLVDLHPSHPSLSELREKFNLIEFL